MVMPTLEVPELVRKHLVEASPDVLRELVKVFAEALLGSDVDAICNAGYGQRSPDGTNRRNGYRNSAVRTMTRSLAFRPGQRADSDRGCSAI
jgi:transposase-like protein